MKKLIVRAALIAVTASINVVYGQASPAAVSAPAKRTDVYSITFIHVAAGKASGLEDWAKKAATSASNATHGLVLRHEAGSPWDYVAMTHIGAKATVEASGNPNGAALRTMMDWHDDTFVNGPAWAEFAKEMDLDEANGKPKSADSVYVVSVYRPILGQEDALEKFLSEPPNPAENDLTAGNVVLQHLEGGPWRFCTVARYKNYEDYAKSEASAVAATAKGSSSWFRLRDLVSMHNDTIAVSVVH